MKERDEKLGEASMHLAIANRQIDAMAISRAALEAEVKELREENARQRGSAEAMVTWSERCVSAEYKLTQMEKALREARKWCPGCGGREYVTDPGPPTQQTRQFCPVCRFIRTALSPSDTEEKL